jgi:hypothetical protein
MSRRAIYECLCKTSSGIRHAAAEASGPSNYMLLTLRLPN